MGVPLMPPEAVAAMFARVDEAKPDIDAIRRKFPGCRYGEERRQAVDIYLPAEGQGPFPVVFFLHGGGFTGGARYDAQMAPFITAINHGYAFVSVGYRLVPQVLWPENLLDVRRALRWVAENAGTYLLDTSRCALCGASAGGMLALMTAYTAGNPMFDDAPLSSTCTIRAVIDQFAPTDFLNRERHFDESGYPRAVDPDSDTPELCDMLLGIKLKDAPNLSRFVNPVDNVHPDVPPTLIMHGRYDPIVPYQQSVELYEKINAVAGHDRAELWLSDEFLHADPGYANEEGQRRIYEYLNSFML